VKIDKLHKGNIEIYYDSAWVSFMELDYAKSKMYTDLILSYESNHRKTTILRTKLLIVNQEFQKAYGSLEKPIRIKDNNDLLLIYKRYNDKRNKDTGKLPFHELCSLLKDMNKIKAYHLYSNMINLELEGNYSDPQKVELVRRGIIYRTKGMCLFSYDREKQKLKITSKGTVLNIKLINKIPLKILDLTGVKCEFKLINNLPNVCLFAGSSLNTVDNFEGFEFSMEFY